MNDEPTNDVERWAAMQDAVNARGAESRAKQRQAKPTGPLKAGPDPDYSVTQADLDAIHQRRAERLADEAMRGEMAFAQCLGAAPSIVAAFQKLKDQGRG